MFHQGRGWTGIPFFFFLFDFDPHLRGIVVWIGRAILADIISRTFVNYKVPHVRFASPLRHGAGHFFNRMRSSDPVEFVTHLKVYSHRELELPAVLGPPRMTIVLGERMIKLGIAFTACSCY